MPSQGSSLNCGKRDVFMNNKFIKKLREKFPDIDLTDNEIKDICNTSNLKIVECVYKDPTGFRLPHGIGIIAICKFKPKKVIYDYANSAKYDKAIPYVNFHSYGHVFVIRHFKYTESKYQSRLHAYKFLPDRKFKRNLAKIIKETGGEIYQSFNNQSFLSKSKLTSLFALQSKQY